MKAIMTAAILAFLIAGAGQLRADAPDIEPGVLIQDGGSPLEVEIMSKPCVVDWNNDGKKDLVVGQFTDGYVWLFLNQGTDEDPVFNGKTRIQSGGTPITTTYG